MNAVPNDSSTNVQANAIIINRAYHGLTSPDCSNVSHRSEYASLLYSHLQFRIATMIKTPSTNPKVKATLILAPLALLISGRWRLEIELKTNKDLKVLIYYQGLSLCLSCRGYL